MTVTMAPGRGAGRSRDRRSRVRSSLAALVATMSLVSAACSSGSSGGGEDDSSTADEEFNPVTFTSPWGDSTLEARPERIAAVGYKDTDIVASMGETPVIVPENTVRQETWTLDALSKDPAVTFEYTENGMPPMEELAAAEPDLIIASQLDLKDVYDQLSDIAPVIAAETQDDVAGNWQQTLINLGEALGEEERADEVVQQTDDAVASVRKKHPEFAGKTVSLIQYFGLDEMRLLNPAGGDAAALFSDMGFDEDPETTELQGVQLGELQDSAVFRSIPAVRDGHSLVITNNAFTEGNEPSFEADGKHYEGNLAWAVAYPGPLSTQWAVETLTPLLADTVG